MHDRTQNKLADYLGMPAEAADGNIPSADAEVNLVATGEPLMRTPGLALYYNDGVFGVPESMLMALSRSLSLPKTASILTVRRVSLLDPELTPAQSTPGALTHFNRCPTTQLKLAIHSRQHDCTSSMGLCLCIAQGIQDRLAKH